MTFVHDDVDWPALLQIVATAADRSIALVEKDYWVTHTLWSMLGQAGLPTLLETLRQEDRVTMPAPAHPALNPSDSERWRELHAAWEAIAPMFWGERIALEDACAEIRVFLTELAGSG